MRRLFLAFILTSLAFTARDAHAMCNEGWPRIVGAEPDLAFATNTAAERTITIGYKTMGNAGGSYCLIAARSDNPKISIQEIYNSTAFVKTPEMAAIGPAAVVGTTKFVTFKVKLASSLAVTGEYIDLFAKTSDIAANYERIGRINVFIDPTIVSNNFQVTANSSTLNNGAVTLDHPMLNDNKYRLLHVAPFWTGTYNNHVIGVDYNETLKRWQIRNQDLTAIPSGMNFNVKIDGNTSFFHVVSSANKDGAASILDQQMANNNPDAVVIVTPTKTSAGVRNTHQVGVFFNTVNKRWELFNEEGPDLTTGAFMVRVIGIQNPAPATSGMIHVNGGNGTSHVSSISNINFDSSARLFSTPNWSPQSVYNRHVTGLWWSGSSWNVYNEDFGAMPQKAAFNIWRIASSIVQ